MNSLSSSLSKVADILNNYTSINRYPLITKFRRRKSIVGIKAFGRGVRVN